MLIERQDTYAVIHLSGRVDVSFVQQYREQVMAALSGAPSLVVHLGKVAFLDSSALGLLVTLNQAAKEQDKQLTLRDVPPRVLELLRLTRLEHLFGILTTTAENSPA